MGATRTRCKDQDSLRTLLFWYATRKFSQTDEQYIDSNDWDDAMCDLDPRVFQAFVWLVSMRDVVVVMWLIDWKCGHG